MIVGRDACENEQSPVHSCTIATLDKTEVVGMTIRKSSAAISGQFCSFLSMLPCAVVSICSNTWTRQQSSPEEVWKHAMSLPYSLSGPCMKCQWHRQINSGNDHIVHLDCSYLVGCLEGNEGAGAYKVLVTVNHSTVQCHLNWQGCMWVESKCATLDRVELWTGTSPSSVLFVEGFWGWEPS